MPHIKNFLKIILEYTCGVIILSAITLFVLNYYNFRIVNAKDIRVFICIMAIICLFLIILLHALINYLGKRRYLKSPLSKIDKMTGEEFEAFLKVYFEKRGYKVTSTPISNDYGADLVCKDRYETIAVQAKRYEANVGNSAIQEVVAARDYYEADRCIVVTNSFFTRNAIALAEANDVELWDRNELAKLK